MLSGFFRLPTGETMSLLLPAHRVRFMLILLAILASAVPAHAQNSKENADFKLALNLYNDGLFDLAAEQFRQFVSAYPSTPQGIDARFYLGLAEMKLGQYEQARTTFQSFALAYQDHPRAPEAWWNSGECFVALRNFREAALAYERVKVFHPKSTQAPEALVRAGQYFTLAGRPDDARRVLRIVLQEYGSSPAVAAARTRLGELYFAEGNLQQARSELQRVVEGDPSPEAKAQALLVLGNIARAGGNDAQASSLFGEVLEKHAASSAAPAAHLGLGKLLATQGRYRDALEHLKKALEAGGPVDSSLRRDALIAAGDASAAVREYTPAARYYNSFMSAFPADSLLPSVLWRSAVINSTVRNFSRSNELLTRLLAAGNAPLLQRRARIQLAVNALAQGNAPLAYQYDMSYAEMHPDDPATPAVLLRAARIAMDEMQDDRKAAATFELIAGRYPRSEPADDALKGAAAACERMHDPGRALELYRDLIRRYPASEERPDAEQKIRMLETFEIKDKDAGLEKLALLLGDLVARRDPEGLAYRLGETYFSDLKNYSAAAAQFTAAIGGGLADERFINALFLRARAYENLTLQDAQYRGQAIASYETFLASFAADPRAADAAVSLFVLRSADPDSISSAYASARAVTAAEPRRDTLMLLYGIRLMDADSIAPALQAFSALMDEDRGPVSEEASYRRFLCYTKLNQGDSALAAGRAFVRAYPAGMHAAEILVRIGEAALAQGAYDEARKCFADLSERFPYTRGGADARRRLADATALAGEHEEAAALYRTLLAEHAADPLSDENPDGALVLGLARSLVASGRSNEAVPVLQEFVATHPAADDAGAAFNTLGLIAQKQGSLDLATSYFRRAGAAAPDAPASREIADMLYTTGSFADALKQYRRLAETAETADDRRYFTARTILSRLKTGEAGDVEKDIESFARTYPDAREDRAAFDLERGNLLFGRQEYARARTVFEHVADAYENTASAPTALYWIGKILEVSGKAQEARKQYEAILKAYPAAAVLQRVHLALGNIAYAAEKWDAAVQHYRAIVDSADADPGLLPFAMSNLIETYETAGIYDAALALARKYLELYPESDDSFDKKIKIGILYQRLGYNDQSIAQLESLLDQAGSDMEAEIRYAIGEANYGKGAYQQAILEFLKVPYLVTKKGKVDWTANALYMSGQSYEKLGRHDQALVMYQQIVDRQGIDETFKAAARKEIQRVRTILKSTSP
jgi:TolA-binding protein